MPDGTVYLSREGYEKLCKELDYLKKVRRKELSKAIGEAREKGDLKENAEYHAAKEDQARVENMISKLEAKLLKARIIEDAGIKADKVYIGATVTVKDLDSDGKFSYTLVDPAESDSEKNKISINSPIGQSRLGHKVGDTVNIKAPAGVLKYEIVKITR